MARAIRVRSSVPVPPGSGPLAISGRIGSRSIASNRPIQGSHCLSVPWVVRSSINRVMARGSLLA